MKPLLIALAFLGLTVSTRAQLFDNLPKVITCEVLLIELPRLDANRLVPNTGYVVRAEALQQLQELVNDRRATILAQPRLATINGVQAQIKAVRELIYPSEFEASGTPSINASNVTIQVSHSPMTVSPASFKTRELGVILNYTPTVGSDGNYLNIALTPEFSQEAKSGFVQHEMHSPAGKTVVGQPDIYSWNAATSIVLRRGTTVLLGMFDPVRDGQYLAQEKVVLMLLTANVNAVE